MEHCGIPRVDARLKINAQTHASPLSVILLGSQADRTPKIISKSDVGNDIPLH